MASPLLLSKDLAKRLWKNCLLSAARFTAAFCFSLLLSLLFRCLTSIEDRVIGELNVGPRAALASAQAWLFGLKYDHIASKQL
ncbi:hypothetical protein CDAR_452811 [Caerostris darwini]|uniref:Uncharacterized protein n=1 Tax=Caerostris darwini TaxID=1538125 RepID=A0AAV4SK43_9ARAC|nr:hypothetical protein CDAR_452811 [Caerostris darwini]